MYFLDVETSLKDFKQALDCNIYVDKSSLIEKISKYIRTNQKYICINRPIRFGKTMNARMLAAYYTVGYDSHSLFDSLKIAKTVSYEEHINKHHVIFIDFSRFSKSYECYNDYIREIKLNIAQDMKEVFGCELKQGKAIQQLFLDSKDKFIFIFDEWDSVFYEPFMRKEDKSSYLEFLKGLLKDQPYVELAYMTGILPIPKYSSASGFNMFDEYHFINDNIYERFFGFNEDEVRKLCMESKSISYETLKYWCGGYYLQDGTSLFSPSSVIRALTSGKCQSYWIETDPMNEIANCIEQNVDEVREDIVKLVAGIPLDMEIDSCSVHEFQQNNREEILSAMVVNGYLSYYDGYIRIPNYELMEKFHQVLKRRSMGVIAEIVRDSEKIVQLP